MTSEDRTVEALPNGDLRVTETDLVGRRVAYVIPEHELHLTDTDHDLAPLLALRDEFKALVDDPTAENRTERILELRERFLDWRDAMNAADAEAEEGEEP